MRIELDGVSKAFVDGYVAVHDTDLAIDDGELRVLLGPSGCGKSTVLRMIAGLDHPTRGRVLLDGSDAADLSPGDREIAFAFQQHALYPNMTVAQNLAFPLRMSGVRRAEIAARVDDVLRSLQLDDVADKRPSRLSGGQQQRVSLGRSIIRAPRAFLMDEPLSNLDAHLRGGARTLIRRIQRREPTTTVFVTHDQDEAMTLADRITLMRAGRVVQTDSPTRLYTAPTDVFTAAFVGSPPMNLFEATVGADEDGRVLEIGSAVVPLSHRLRYRVGDAPEVGTVVGVGIRAEALTRDDGGEFRASVHATESLGSEQLVHAVIDAPTIELGEHGHRVRRAREGRIVARVPVNDRVGLFAPFSLRVDPASLHLFDLATGAALTTPAG